MRLPLFNVFEYPHHSQLYDALRSAGPERAWALMTELGGYFDPIYRSEVAEFEEVTRVNIRKFMDLAPALATLDKEALVEQAVNYGPKLMFESTYLTLWLGDPDRLFDEVVRVKGVENLERARAVGNGVLVLPIHLGPAYAIGPLISHFIPTRLVFNRMNFEEIRLAAFPELPVEGFQLDSTSAFRAGLRALREGKAFSMFPELDPRGVDRHHELVDFLGIQVAAPTGPVLLSQASRAPMLPVVLASVGAGKFELTFYEAILAPERGESPSAALKALWRVIETEILSGDTGEWEMWHEFDRMLPGTLQAAEHA